MWWSCNVPTTSYSPPAAPRYRRHTPTEAWSQVAQGLTGSVLDAAVLVSSWCPQFDALQHCDQLSAVPTTLDACLAWFMEQDAPATALKDSCLRLYVHVRRLYDCVTMRSNAHASPAWLDHCCVLTARHTSAVLHTARALLPSVTEAGSLVHASSAQSRHECQVSVAAVSAPSLVVLKNVLFELECKRDAGAWGTCHRPTTSTTADAAAATTPALALYPPTYLAHQPPRLPVCV